MSKGVGFQKVPNKGMHSFDEWSFHVSFGLSTYNTSQLLLAVLPNTNITACFARGVATMP